MPRDADWNPALVETLYDLLYKGQLRSRALESKLRALERQHDGAVYSDLIHLLSHLRFDPAEAKRCWEQIVAHRAAMEKRLRAPVDVRVALVSYFLDVNRQLENPKIIELKVFEQTQASAYRDDLTGLWNYRYFREYLAREIDRGKRYNPPLSLVMIDIDDFKSYNDRNGHEAGNRALAAMARLLTGSLRRVDVAARYGGEEFALVLPSTAKTGAQLVAERTRERIERHSFVGEDGREGDRLTVSMGIATCPADAAAVGGLIRCADSAMYVAKTQGKNQVHMYGQNRRSYRRINAALDGTFCTLAAEYHPLTTINVSEGGLLFIADRSLPAGSLIDVTLNLPGTERRIATSGRVIRVEDRGDGRFEAAIRIIDISTRDQGLLTKYVHDTEPRSESEGDEDGPRTVTGEIERKR
jgi:diguanylate cyclase (GGDEF)-like protein